MSWNVLEKPVDDLAGQTRILIVDDHPVVRAGVREMLEAESDMQVIGEAATAQEALQQLRNGVQADVLLLGIPLSERNGVQVLEQMTRSENPPAVLVLSMHPEQGFPARVLRAGASGYVPKMAVPQELIKALRTVRAGHKYLTPAMPGPNGHDSLPMSDEAPHVRLSQREMQVFLRIARGVAPSAMAAELGLSVKTVSTYRARILDKLDMKSNAEIAVYAVRHQLVE